MNKRRILKIQEIGFFIILTPLTYLIVLLNVCIYPTITFDSTDIIYNNSFKYLRVILDSKLGFTKLETS